MFVLAALPPPAQLSLTMVYTYLIGFSLGVAVALSSEEATDAAQAHVVQLAALRSQIPNPLCFAKCAGPAEKCAADSGCRSALGCTMECAIKSPLKQNLTCVFHCASDFENDVYDNMVYCLFNQHDCMGTKKGFDKWKACRPIEKATPMQDYRGAPLSKEVARQIVMRGTNHRGDWIVAKGQSGSFDCFDCQFLYWGYRPDNTMYYSANYKVQRSDGGIRWNTAIYNSSEWKEGTGRFLMHASNYGGLEHEEDWRMLGADESEPPQWVAMYYCGAAPGVGEAYEGAFVLTADGNLPADPKAVAAIEAVYAKAGITLACKTDNSNCTGHPTPPYVNLAVVV